VADKATSLLAAQSVLAALLARERTGAGCRIELSMLDSLSYFNFADATSTSALVDHPELEGFGAPTAMLATADGHVVIAPNRRREVRNVCIAAGHPEWSEQLIVLEDFREIVGRLADLLEPIGGLATTGEWMERFSEHGVPAAPVLDLAGHIEDPQVAHNKTYGELDDPRLGRFRFARHPARFVLPDDSEALTDFSPHHGFPDLGQHTSELVTGRGDDPGGANGEGSPAEHRPQRTAEEE
jgi:crotonobetainyl-CoA:carnitine CoA-transferase CaiB-like acyl-CoA transferase